MCANEIANSWRANCWNPLCWLWFRTQSIALPKPLIECNFTLPWSFLVWVSDINLYTCCHCVLFWQEIKNQKLSTDKHLRTAGVVQHFLCNWHCRVRSWDTIPFLLESAFRIKCFDLLVGSLFKATLFWRRCLLKPSYLLVTQRIFSFLLFLCFDNNSHRENVIKSSFNDL